MPPKLRIESLKGVSDKGKLNQEWFVLINEGDAPFNGEGCSVTVARSGGARPKTVTTLKAGLIVKANEKVRIVSGSSGKKSHGEPPADDVRNFHLFLKVPFLDRPGVIRLVNRQHELCRATYEGEEKKS